MLIDAKILLRNKHLINLGFFWTYSVTSHNINYSTLFFSFLAIFLLTISNTYMNFIVYWKCTKKFHFWKILSVGKCSAFVRIIKNGQKQFAINMQIRRQKEKYKFKIVNIRVSCEGQSTTQPPAILQIVYNRSDAHTSEQQSSVEI